MTDEGERVLTDREFAATYDLKQYDNSWQPVEQYRDVQEYHERYPDKGSTAVANALELPRGRVHGWLDGGKPDQVKGLEFGRQYGWFEHGWESGMGQAFNTLVAAVFAGGTIGDRDLIPRFTLGKGYEDRIIAAVERLTGGSRIVEDQRAPARREVLPATGQSVLGRALITLGAPRGAKNSKSEISLPSYLDRVSTGTKEDFLRLYLQFRVVNRPNNTYLVIREERPESFLDELTALFDRTLPGEIYRKSSIVIPYEAADSLGVSY